MKEHFKTVQLICHSQGFQIISAHADEEFEKLRYDLLPS
jgi:hypothetical protein